MGNSYNEYLNRISHPTPTEDDGSLSFLGISTDRDRKSFSCEAKKGMSAKEIHKAVGGYQGWLNYGNTRNLIHKLNTIGNGKVFK